MPVEVCSYGAAREKLTDHAMKLVNSLVLFLLCAVCHAQTISRISYAVRSDAPTNPSTSALSVAVDLRNDQNAPITVDQQDFTLVDAKENVYAPSIPSVPEDVAIVSSPRWAPLPQRINPGVTITPMLFFLIPRELAETDLKICLHGSCQALDRTAVELEGEQSKAYRLRIVKALFAKWNEPNGIPAGASTHLRAGIGPDGTVHDLAAIKGSGYEDLDRSCLDSVSFAGKVEAPPAGADLWLYFYCGVSASHPYTYGLDDLPSSPYLGKAVDAPQLVYSVNPKFPRGFRKYRGFETLVVVHLTVDADGKPQQVSIKRSSNPDFDKCAVDAVKQYRFKPAMLNNQPFAIQVEIEVHFHVE